MTKWLTLVCIVQMAYYQMTNVDIECAACPKEFNRDKPEESGVTRPHARHVLQPRDFVGVAETVGEGTQGGD